VLARLRSEGVRVCSYLDDLLIFGESTDACRQAGQRVAETLTDLGFLGSVSKIFRGNRGNRGNCGNWAIAAIAAIAAKWAFLSRVLSPKDMPVWIWC
jgi:hypothetical protein